VRSGNKELCGNCFLAGHGRSTCRFPGGIAADRARPEVVDESGSMSALNRRRLAWNLPPVHGRPMCDTDIARCQESSILQQQEIQRLHREIRQEELRQKHSARKKKRMQRLQREIKEVKQKKEIKLQEVKQKNESNVWILDSAAAMNCVDEGLFDNGTNPLKDVTVATLTGLKRVSVVGDIHIAWKTATGEAFVDVLRQVVGIPNCPSNILSMGLLLAQGAYFSINDNSQGMYMRLPGNDMKFPITLAEDNTLVMRIEVLPTPGVQPVSAVPPGPPKALPYLEEIRVTKSMTKFLRQKTEWIGNKNVKMYYPPALSWTEDECMEQLSAMRWNERQTNEFKDNSKGVEYYNFASKRMEYCNSLHDMTEHSHHVPLHASAVSVQQPFIQLARGWPHAILGRDK